jgi:hypothetical protein
MASYLRSLLPLAAAVAAVSLLSITSPASAAGIAVAGEAAGANAANTLPDLRRRTPQRVRLAASRDRYVRPTRNDLDCSGAWCRRHFVLMIGIAY